jgi:hypothetical protein
VLSLFFCFFNSTLKKVFLNSEEHLLAWSRFTLKGAGLGLEPSSSIESAFHWHSAGWDLRCPQGCGWQTEY